MAEMIKKWEVVDKLTNLENKLQRYKPFTKHEQEMYYKICLLGIEIGKTSGVELIHCKDCKHGGVFVIEDKVPFFACYKDKPDIKPVKRDWFCADGARKDDAELRLKRNVIADEI